jgi:hypothetical protein
MCREYGPWFNLVFVSVSKVSYAVGAITFIMTTFSITTPRIIDLFATPSINDTQHSNVECNYAVCHYTEGCLYLNVILSDIMLSVIMLSVIMLSVIMLSVIILSVIMLSAIMLSAFMLSAIMQSVVAPYSFTT